MKVNKPKAHKQASHCVKWIPVVFLLNYSAQLQQDPTIPLPCMVFSSYGQTFLYSHFDQVSHLAILDLGRWCHCQRPSWDESWDRLTQPWHPWCNIGLWWSTKMPQLKWRFEPGGSVIWEMMGRQGHYQFFSQCACWSEATFGFPHLEVHWTSPRQGWCPAQQPWEWSRGWRGLLWWIQLVHHQASKFTEQNSNWTLSVL